MSESDVLSKLDVVGYLYLSQLSEPRDNSLRIVVEEAIINKRRVAESPSPELNQLFENAHPIESTVGCRTFELYWNRYAAYCVTEELVGSNTRTGYDDESYTRKILRFYAKSHFLDHIMRDTGGHLEAVQHWKLVCLNHLIDVAAYSPPEITAVGAHDGRMPQQRQPLPVHCEQSIDVLSLAYIGTASTTEFGARLRVNPRRFRLGDKRGWRNLRHRWRPETCFP